jgi:hypothetical protein
LQGRKDYIETHLHEYIEHALDWGVKQW